MQHTVSINNQNGFTLVEVMLAVVILGVGLVGVAQLQGNAQKFSTLSKERVEAITIAQKEMEKIRHFATTSQYEAIVTNKLTGSTVNSSTVNGKTTVFTMMSTVTPVNYGLGADIMVKVTWPDREANGTVTDNTKVYLATKVSNNVPISFGMSAAGPPRDKTSNPDNPEIIFPDTGNSCSCSTYTASLDLDGNIRKVSMGGGNMGSGGSSTTTTTVTSTECGKCCNIAYGGGSYDDDDDARLESDFSYASATFSEDSPTLYNEFDMNNLEDRVIGQNTFDMRYLIKGYKTNRKPKFINESELIGSGMTQVSSTTTYVDYAACSYTVVSTSTTKKVSCMHHKWTSAK